jgi:trinucleotide repeat-containing gene 6 protein
MAVQAGHLNPQILNQPLAPQTLLLLNQLLQQIKQLQSYQQQHVIAQQGQRPGAPSNQALLALTVQITKHKQQIGNLQNQITAQQAQYLKNQQPQQQTGHGGPEDLLPGLGNMSMGEQTGSAVGGSKVLKMLGADKFGEEFPKAPGAPGTSRAPNSQSSPNLLLENNGPWSNAHGSDAGWPSSGEKPTNTSTSEEDNFGIPEFVPGKAWKGTALKDPSEDPTLTPGSVAPAAVTTVENSLGLTSSTWSFNTATTKETSSTASKEPWGNSQLPTSSSATNLTAMGQDLWGQSRTLAASKQQTPASSGWPSSNGLSSGSGWSNGTNGGASSTTTTTAPGQPGPASSWLLLKNLTTQIDGSTLQTLCKQHGPLMDFRLYLPHGIALVKYSNGQEAKKAQNALNNCVLGNTTILAETTGEHEIGLIMQTISSGGQSQAQQAPPAVSHRGSTPATPFGGGGGGGSSAGYNSLAKSSSGDTWSALASGVSLGWPSTSSSSSGLGGSVWGAPDGDQHSRNTPLQSFLPNDLLAEGM